MRIGFTGTRFGMSDRQKVLLAGLLTQAHEFHHGDCIGTDAEADVIVRQTSNSIASPIQVVIHPPDDDSERAFCGRYEVDAISPVRKNYIIMPEKPYLLRNRDIVDSTDLLIAAPLDENREELRSGTWSTVRYARRIGRPVVILPR